MTKYKCVTERVSRHRLELMRHIYNGGGDIADFTDKDQLWSSGGDQDQESGSRPPRWVMLSTLPHTMCVDPQISCLA